MNVYMQIGSNIFYFPSVHIFRRLEKDITLLKLPKTNIGIDFLRTTETFTLKGTWRDDNIDSQYDGLTAFDRYLRFMSLIKYGSSTAITGPNCYLTWKDHTYICKVNSFKPGKYSGHGYDLDYSIAMIRVTVTVV